MHTWGWGDGGGVCERGSKAGLLLPQSTLAGLQLLGQVCSASHPPPYTSRGPFTPDTTVGFQSWARDFFRKNQGGQFWGG